ELDPAHFRGWKTKGHNASRGSCVRALPPARARFPFRIRSRNVLSSRQLRQQADLLIQTQEVERIPRFGNLAVVNACDTHAPKIDLVAGRRNAEMMSMMGARDMTMCAHHIALGHCPHDINVDIRKCSAKPSVKRAKRFRSFQRQTIGAGEAVCKAVACKEPV